MNKLFTNPDIEVCKLLVKDVITTSFDDAAVGDENGDGINIG